MTVREERCEFDPDRLDVLVDETVPASLVGLPSVVARIMEAVGRTGCAEGHEFEVEVAVNEALANAVRHGCKENPEHSVQVCVACDMDRGLIIVVRDPGGGFDPSCLPSPVSGENLHRSHGRGIFLINRLMDEVRFERGGTEIWMRKGPASD